MYDKDLNSPARYAELSVEKQARLQAWIEQTFAPASRADVRTSYGWKHYFEGDEDSFYITNGEFKGAMLAAGYQPTKRTVNDMNWCFKVKPIRKLPAPYG